MVIDMDDELEQLKWMDQADRASWIDELRRRISPKSRLEPEKMLSTIQSLKKLVEPVASEPIACRSGRPRATARRSIKRPAPRRCSLAPMLTHGRFRKKLPSQRTWFGVSD